MCSFGILRMQKAERERCPIRLRNTLARAMDDCHRMYIISLGSLLGLPCSYLC